VSTSVTFTAGGGSVSDVVTGSGTGTTPPPPSGLTIGSRVQTTLETAVRPTPGSSTMLALQPIGAQGTVVGGPGSAWGYTWWQIDYDSGADGWSSGDRLVAVAPPPVMTINSRVQVVNQVMSVRATPGGTLLGNQPVGAFGKIVGGPQRAAISGSGSTTQYTYWQIDYDTGVDGWSREDRLVLSQQSAATTSTRSFFASVLYAADGGTISKASISSVAWASQGESPRWALANRASAQTSLPAVFDFCRPPDAFDQAVRPRGTRSHRQVSGSLLVELRDGNVDWRRHAFWISTRPIDGSAPRAG
jgi:hypothetical protein